MIKMRPITKFTKPLIGAMLALGFLASATILPVYWCKPILMERQKKKLEESVYEYFPRGFYELREDLGNEWGNSYREWTNSFTPLDTRIAQKNYFAVWSILQGKNPEFIREYDQRFSGSDILLLVYPPVPPQIANEYDPHFMGLDIAMLYTLKIPPSEVKEYKIRDGCDLYYTIKEGVSSGKLKLK